MQLQHVDNYTPFEWFAFEKMAPGMHIHDVLIVKAACQILLDGNAYRIAAVPEGEIAPIHMSDQAHDFDRNVYVFLRVAGDTVLYKPATDLLLSGEALPPDIDLRLMELPPDERIEVLIFLRRSGMLTTPGWTIDRLLAPSTRQEASDERD